MKHTMKLLARPFNAIKDGSKTIEFRLYDDKRKQIKIGDQIEFCLVPDLTETITVEVLDLYKADSFEILLNQLFDDPNLISKKLNGIRAIYSEEEEKEFGVLGIKIKLL